MSETMPSPERTLRRCLVCGSAEVRTDEVVDRGWVLLAECARCNRRWTAQAEPGPALHVVRTRPAAREVASAA
ncbi:MAG TPA: hypothetical protein VIY27_04190 [Myxococcota bacterium]